MLLINNMLLVFVSVVASYATKKFNIETEEKKHYREKKLKSLENFHYEKMSVLGKHSL